MPADNHEKYLQNRMRDHANMVSAALGLPGHAKLIPNSGGQYSIPVLDVKAGLDFEIILKPSYDVWIPDD